MAGKRGSYQRTILRVLWAALLSISLLLPPVAVTTPAAAAGNDRTLFLYHTHTGKTGQFTFKRNGQYDQRVLKELNVFLADWRTGEPTKMDPALFDLLWLVYQKVRANQPINIVSSYRSPATNKMLRSKSSGVAENSQHIKGNAMDFYIPGVPLTKLREVAMYYQVGGVGFYPTSGSPFVHLDTGSVRAWPRMTRAQLKKVFPDGRTLHVPTDGKPLSADGRRYAEAEWKKCRMVPCNGESLTPMFPDETSSPDVMTADLAPPVPAVRSNKDIFQASFDLVESVDVASIEPARRVVETVAVQTTAPVPLMKSRALAVATATIPPTDNGETALVALANIGAPVPARRSGQDDEPSMVTAYVPAIEPDPGAQLALRMIIERETTGSIAPPVPAPKPSILGDAPVFVASLGPVPLVTPSAPAEDSTLAALGNIFDATWNSVTNAPPAALANALQARTAPQPNGSFGGHEIEMMAPDFEHVGDTMTQPVLMSASFYDELYEPDGWLDKTTELGPLVTRMGIDPVGAIPAYDRFVVDAPLLVASR